ncbi:MAG TPA: DUF4214 domain-containing protein, partial [Gemmataceae bacterium]|nr:DUF4214 domain-containing protein [Gemmataceae bacterium]
GTVFELSSGTLTTLASFNGTANGAMAHATLIMDSSGNLYGTTTSGGAFTGGTIFQLERAAADFLVAGFPSPATAGVAHAFTVTAENGYGTVDSNYTGTVSFTSSDGQAVLPQAYTFTAADAGMHTFSGTFETAGTQSVTATDVNRSNLNGAQSGILVAPAAASKFVFSSVPAAATAGTAFNFTVTAEDPFNNTATAYAGTVAFTSSDGAAALPAASSLINGVGTFSATLKTAAAAGQTITATDTASASVTGTSGAVAVSPAAATHFTVAAPGTAIVGTALNFTVTAEDQFDNTATGYTGNVNFTSSDGAAVLPANATLTKGVGTFSVTLNTAGSQKITAADTVTSSITGTSTAVVVSAGTTTISGTVFQDININGVQDPGEPGLAGETVFLDLSGTGTLATGDPSTTTDANGNYAFTVASPGTYTVRMVLLGGMLEDTPASGGYQVTVSGANVTGENFAIVPTSITVPLTLPPTSAFPAQGNAPADYVEAVFRVVLNRNADAGGLSFWTKQLNSGADTRLQVVQGIRNSLEHFGQEVDAFYQTLLSRPSDAGGRAFWVAQLENGLREEQIAFAFLNSPEYLSKGDKFFVDSMYQSLLGRPFDASGQAFWLGQLGDDAAGNPTGNPLQTHAQVVTDFLLSTESLQRLVEGYYEVFLQRQADASGLNSWVSELQQGLPFLTLGEEIIASDEFFNKAAAHG